MVPYPLSPPRWSIWQPLPESRAGAMATPSVLPSVALQTLGVAGGPLQELPPTSSQSGGRQSILPVGGGQPSGGQNRMSGTQNAALAVSGRQDQPDGQSESTVQVSGTGGATQDVLASQSVPVHVWPASTH